MAQAKREQDDAIRHSYELEKKLGSVDADARALADAAAKAAKEEAKVREEEVAQQIGRAHV